jgi:hypothetical protein
MDDVHVLAADVYLVARPIANGGAARSCCPDNTDLPTAPAPEHPASRHLERAVRGSVSKPVRAG